MKKLLNSKTIDSVGYDGSTMTIKFKSGGIYKYSGVTQKEHDELMEAKSAGTHFHKNLKKKYKGERHKP
jgi:hypothetical protein